MDAAVIRATGAGAVVHSRVVRGHDGELRLLCASRGAVRFKGKVAAERPTDLAARSSESIAQALHPGGALASAATPHDPLADEAFARGLLAAAEGRHAEAVEALLRAVRLQPERGQRRDEEQSLPRLIDASIASGLLEKAETELQATQAAHLSGSRDLKAQAAHGRAALAHARGFTDEATSCRVQLADSDAAPRLSVGAV